MPRFYTPLAVAAAFIDATGVVIGALRNFGIVSVTHVPLSGLYSIEIADGPAWLAANVDNVHPFGTLSGQDTGQIDVTISFPAATIEVMTFDEIGVPAERAFILQVNMYFDMPPGLFGRAE